MRLKTHITPLAIALTLANLATLGAVVATPTPANAQTCSYAMTDVDFGSMNAFTGGETLGQAAFTARCTGSAGQTAKVCFYIERPHQQPMYPPAATGFYVLYDAYQNAARTTLWSANTTPPPPLFLPLQGDSTPVTRTETVYFKTEPFPSHMPPDLYSANLTGVQGAVLTTYAATGACPTNHSAAVAGPAYRASIRVTKACEMEADPLNFGAYAQLSSAIHASTDIHVRCSNGTPFSVALGYGLNGTSATTRRMRQGGTYVAYGLYVDTSFTTVFGSELGQTRSGTGNGARQNISVYGRVPAQSAPPAGTYVDVVIATVTY